jgi:hypothetical protein
MYAATNRSGGNRIRILADVEPLLDVKDELLVPELRRLQQRELELAHRTLERAKAIYVLAHYRTNLTKNVINAVT